LSPVDQRVVVKVVLKKGAGCGSRNILMDAVPRQSHFAP
jgi:hypothetical protein